MYSFLSFLQFLQLLVFDPIVFFRFWCQYVTMEKCLFCNQSLSDGQPTVFLGAKGSNGVNDTREARGSNLSTETGQCVHRDCRRLFTNPKNIAAAKRQLTAPDPPPVCVLRSETPYFIFKERCFSVDRLLSMMVGKGDLNLYQSE